MSAQLTNILLKVPEGFSAQMEAAMANPDVAPDWLKPPVINLWDIPGTRVLPGSRAHNGSELVHIIWRGTVDAFGVYKPPQAEIIAAQDSKAGPRYEYDDEGNVTGEALVGVYTPVPAEVADYLVPDVQTDEETGETTETPKAPGTPLHTFAGATPWVWA